MRLRIRALLHALRKPFVPPLKEWRRSADKRIHQSPPRRREKSLPAYAARTIVLSRTARDQNGGALAFRRPTAVMRRGFLSLDSAPGRASWNYRMQAGGPSPAPVQPAPGSPVTRRTVDAQSRPEARCMAASGNRSRSTFESTLAKGPLRERDGGGRNRNGDGCQGRVARKETVQTPPSAGIRFAYYVDCKGSEI